MKLVAITSCPMGIAHTYMAAEMLLEAAKALGVTIKIETHGQLGIENRLLKQDINEAHAVIIASDQWIDLDRFNGKRCLHASVRKAITHASDLIQEAIKEIT